jgi:DNA invertase Pin-like site-specific DNA recombinase
MPALKIVTADRQDAVYIRKSTEAQEEQAQIDNVEKMLKDQGVYVPRSQWFSDTGSRRKSEKRPDFQRLLELVKADKVRTIYVESQTRWGTKDNKEYFALLRLLCEHKTALYDLRERRTLTKSDMATDFIAVANVYKSVEERHYHKGRPGKPCRPRKTNRPGKYSYTLLKDKIQWAFANSDLECSSRRPQGQCAAGFARRGNGAGAITGKRRAAGGAGPDPAAHLDAPPANVLVNRSAAGAPCAGI